MTLPLTVEMLEAAYEFLRTTPPFNEWNLPEPDDMLFRVIRSRSHLGFYRKRRGGPHTIEISSGTVGHTNNLLMTMAHEMIHLHEGRTGADRGKGEHSAAFKKWAAQTCAIHGFDPKFF